MDVRSTFDEWAERGRDREMADRHWRTARHVLARMPVEEGETVVDLGTGSGYAVRALVDAGGAGRAYGLDASLEMARNAASNTDAGATAFLVGDFGHLPFASGTVDHAFSMEAFYYAEDPNTALEEIHRVLRSGGTCFCAVNFYEENVYSHDWPRRVGVRMTRWSRERYREAFRAAGFHVVEQDQVLDLEMEIPPAGAFPTAGFERREEMIERYRELGTLLTVGVVP